MVHRAVIIVMAARLFKPYSPAKDSIKDFAFLSYLKNGVSMRFRLFLFGLLSVFSCFAMDDKKGKSPADATIGQTIARQARTYPVSFVISRSERIRAPEDETGPFVHIVSSFM